MSDANGPFDLGAGEPADDPAQHQEPPGKRPAKLLGVVGVLAVLAVGWLAFGSGGDDQVTITGEFVLLDFDGFTGRGADCRGTGGYDDFGAGMDVTVRDGSGTIIGSTNTTRWDDEHLEAVLVADDGSEETVETLRDLYESLCVTVLEVEVEPSAFYEISIGSRGELTYSHEELDDQRRFVRMTLGG
jgi:hypothetical protein